MDQPRQPGRFVAEDGDDWYLIDGLEDLPPFFIALASDSDLWAFISTAGSLAAGRRNAEGSFFPYETVDKIHRRWEHTGPRTWIRLIGKPCVGAADVGQQARAVFADRNLAGHGLQRRR